MVEGAPNRREFLKGAAAAATGALIPEDLFGQTSENWPKELSAQVDSLEQTLGNFNLLKDPELRKTVARRGFPELKRRIQEAKENVLAQTASAILKDKGETKPIEALYKRIDSVEREINRIEQELH